MLQIGIDNAQNPAAGLLEAGHHRRSQAALVGANDDLDGIVSRQSLRLSGGPVRAVIVDDYEFVAVRRKRLVYSLDEDPNIVLLIVGGRDQRYLD
jgi:hypothetical protein